MPLHEVQVHGLSCKPDSTFPHAALIASSMWHGEEKSCMLELVLRAGSDQCWRKSGIRLTGDYIYTAARSIAL